MAHFDPYWNKDNKRVSGMFQEASRRKEEEAAAAAQETLNTGDRLIDEQLRSDGWDLDEVSDDDALDFALPPSRAPERTSVWSCLCPCCAPS